MVAITGRDFVAGVEGGASSVWLTDTFTGTDGAAWGSGWALGKAATTGTGATISGNMGLLSSGTTGSYSDNDVVSRRVDVSSGRVPADAEILTTFKVGNSECYPALCLRSYNDATLYYSNGYYIQLYKGGTVTLKRTCAGTTTSLTTASFTITAGTLYKVRFRAEGNVISVRLWAAADSEPGPWTIQYTDTGNAVRGGGYAGVLLMGGSAASAAAQIYLDDFSFTALGGATYPLIGLGTVAETGSGSENAIVDATGGITPITASDTGGSTEATTGKAVSGIGDTGSGAEARGLLAQVPVTDSGSSADAKTTLSVAFTNPEIGTFTEGALVAGLITVVSSTDTAAWADVQAQLAALLSSSDTGSGAEGAGSIYETLPITGGDTGSTGEQGAADADFAHADGGRSADSGSVVRKAFYFTPPTVKEHYPWHGRLSITIDRGVTVLKTSGFYRQVSDPTAEDVQASDIAYPGGRSYPIDEEERQSLIDAGYGSCVALLAIR